MHYTIYQSLFTFNIFTTRTVYCGFPCTFRSTRNSWRIRFYHCWWWHNGVSAGQQAHRESPVQGPVVRGGPKRRFVKILKLQSLWDLLKQFWSPFSADVTTDIPAATFFLQGSNYTDTILNEPTSGECLGKDTFLETNRTKFNPQ